MSTAFRLPDVGLEPRPARAPLAPLPCCAFVGGDVAFRPEAPCDLPFLMAIYAELRRPEMLMVGWDQATRADFITRQFEYQYRHHARAHPAMDHHIILAGGRLAGRLYVDWTAEFGRSARVVDLLLAERFRDQGLGAAIMTTVTLTARARGQSVVLSVDPYSRVRRFYANLGFAPDGPGGGAGLALRWAGGPGRSEPLQLKHAW